MSYYYSSYYSPYYSSYYSPYYRGCHNYKCHYDAPATTTTTTHHGAYGSSTTTTVNHTPYYSSYYRYPSYRRYYDRDYSVTYHYNDPAPVTEVVEEEYITPSRKRTVTRDYLSGTTRVTYTSP